MYQPWLLLVEIVVLGATVYFFWMTQRAAAANRQKIEEMVTAQVKERIEAHNTAMARDVAMLVKEIEETAAEMRAQWTRHSMMLQEGVSRLEALEAAPAFETPAVSPVSPAPAPPVAPSQTGKTFGDALETYYAQLKATGRSTASVNRAIGYVKSFAVWWGGKRYERVQLRPIKRAEMENYLKALKTQGLKPDTIRRKINAVREFLDWLEEYLHAETDAPASAVTPTSPNRTAVPNRKSLVQSLAQQGLDIRAIAAETGMERETVRILLETED